METIYLFPLNWWNLSLKGAGALLIKHNYKELLDLWKQIKNKHY
jgi:hypothetical protein